MKDLIPKIPKSGGGGLGAAIGKIPPNVFAYGLAFFVVAFILTLASRKFGLWRSRTAKKIDKKKEEIEGDQDIAELMVIEDLNTSPWFDPNKWRSAPDSGKLAPDTIIMKKAKNIDDALGFWNDDEEKIYLQFRELNNKWQVSQLAYAWSQLKGTDLVTELLDNLNEEELVILSSIIGTLGT